MAVTEVGNEDIWAKLQKLERDLASATEQLTLDGATLANISTLLTNLSTTMAATQSIATRLTEQTVTPFSTNSLGAIAAAFGAPAPTSQTWPTANKAYYYPFSISAAATCYTAFWANGATVSGNVDLGIYTSAKVKVVSTGSTAQAGTSQTQTVALSASLAPGNYYIGFACDAAAATFIRANLTDVAGFSPAVINLRAGAASFPLPSTATFDSTLTAAVVPFFLCGIALRSDFS